MRKDLPEVTIFAATAVALDATVKALRASLDQVRFARAVLFSDRCPPSIQGTGIEWCRIARIASKFDYSRFILHELGSHISTSHALCVQWDGYVLRGEAWKPEFLNCDYIGAPWPHFSDGKKVGNGGFSLRSKRLLQATSELPYDNSSPEDVVVARIFRDRLEAQGIRFASESLARQFAYERIPPNGEEFGFHGAFTLVRLIPAAEVLQILKEIEPELLTRSEHQELLRWAIKNFRLRLAIAISSRLMKAGRARQLDLSAGKRRID